MLDLPSLSRRRLAALASIAAVGTLGVSLQFFAGTKSARRSLRRMKRLYHQQDWSPKINLNHPYRPHRGDIEPTYPSDRQRHRGLAKAEWASDGSLVCYTEPTIEPERIPATTDYVNTIIVGYPGADKRTVMRQMELMTTLSGRDAWDFQFLGMTRQPFIKTNYPHHEGIWGESRLVPLV